MCGSPGGTAQKLGSLDCFVFCLFFCLHCCFCVLHSLLEECHTRQPTLEASGRLPEYSSCRGWRGWPRHRVFAHGYCIWSFASDCSTLILSPEHLYKISSTQLAMPPPKLLCTCSNCSQHVSTTSTGEAVKGKYLHQSTRNKHRAKDKGPAAKTAAFPGSRSSCSDEESSSEECESETVTPQLAVPPTAPPRILCICSKCIQHVWTTSTGDEVRGKYVHRSTRNKHRATDTEPVAKTAAFPGSRSLCSDDESLSEGVKTIDDSGEESESGVTPIISLSQGIASTLCRRVNH